MTTAADHIREMIQEQEVRIERQGDALFNNTSERLETLWIEIDNHLKAADLCELLCEDGRMMYHLSSAKLLLAKINLMILLKPFLNIKRNNRGLLSASVTMAT